MLPSFSSLYEAVKRQKTLILILLPLVVVLIFYKLWLSICHLCYVTIFEKQPKSSMLSSHVASSFSINEFHSLERPAIKWLKEKQLHKNWIISSRDKLKLSGLYLPSKSPSKNLVILIHGYRGQPEDLSEIARVYHENFNYHVLMPSLRAHGDSEGQIVGFGWKDRIDLIDFIDRSISELGSEINIALHGFSMGAATALMASGDTLPVQVKAIIGDSGFNRLEDELSFMIKQFTGLPPKMMLSQIAHLSSKDLGTNLKNISSKEQLLKCTRPVLLFHNYQDDVVPVQMAYELAEIKNLGKCKISLKLFSGSKHCRSFFEHQEEYVEYLNEFLKENLTITHKKTSENIEE